MSTHVKVIACLQIALGILTLFSCVAMGGFAIFVGHLFQGSMISVGTPANSMIPFMFNPFRSLGWWFVVIGLLSSIPGIIAGVGLLRLAPWGRVLGIVVSILSILTYNPMSVALGVYGLVILFNRETEMLFQSRNSGPGAY